MPRGTSTTPGERLLTWRAGCNGPNSCSEVKTPDTSEVQALTRVNHATLAPGPLGNREMWLGCVVMCRTARDETGLSLFQLYWYERRGLLGEVERNESGWRLFSAEQMDVLRKIAEWRKAGLSIKEMAALLRKDGSAIAKATARRRGELVRLVNTVEVLERAATDLGVWAERSTEVTRAASEASRRTRGARPRRRTPTLRSIEDEIALTGARPRRRLLSW